MAMKMRRKAGDTGTHSPGGLWSGHYSVLVLKFLLLSHLYSVSLQETDCSLRATMGCVVQQGSPSGTNPSEGGLSLLSAFLFSRRRL